MGPWKWNSHEEDYYLYKRHSREIPLSLMLHYSEKRAIHEPRSELSLDTQSASALILDF